MGIKLIIHTNVFFGKFCSGIALQEEYGFILEVKGWDQWSNDLFLFVVHKQLPNILIVYEFIKGKSAMITWGNLIWQSKKLIHNLINIEYALFPFW